jgi:anti-sigma B factor antagonist/stage II sporulation protein AA (anti-sigma F factor antagonist)
MEMHSQTIEDVVVMSLSGRVDHSTAAEYQAELLSRVQDCNQNQHSLVLDMAGVAYMSSVGLRALMVAAKECKKTDVNISIAAMQSEMKEIFEISRFQLIYKTYAEVGEAIAAVSETAATAYATRQPETGI